MSACVLGKLLDFALLIRLPHCICRSFLQRFLKRHSLEESFKDAAKVNKHVLVYHRGIGRDSATGFFIEQKVRCIARAAIRSTEAQSSQHC